MFEKQELVRFGHCDPAGIVFYPRYFEMVNALVEDWFTQGLGVDYSVLLGQRRIGMPTVQFKVDFKRISRMGDQLSQQIRVQKLGRTSLILAIEFHGADGVMEPPHLPLRARPPGGEPVNLGRPGVDLRVAFEQVLVCTSLETHLPIPFPDDLRAALELCSDGNDN